MFCLRTVETTAYTGRKAKAKCQDNPNIPTITASGATTFCEGQTVLLTSSQGTGNLWSDGSTDQNNPVTVSGSYTVTYTDGNGCSSTSDPTVVTVNQLPNVNGGPIKRIVNKAVSVQT